LVLGQTTADIENGHWTTDSGLWTLAFGIGKLAGRNSLDCTEIAQLSHQFGFAGPLAATIVMQLMQITRMSRYWWTRQRMGSGRGSRKL